MSGTHIEGHLVQRIGWLRAAVLGANDGIISTASLILGVAAAAVSRNEVLVAGVAGLVAGAMSMAAGEYVSVSSQADTEKADLHRERRELREQPEFELEELTQIYVERGLEVGLAREVARQLMPKDALAVHARDELGISEITTCRASNDDDRRRRQIAGLSRIGRADQPLVGEASERGAETLVARLSVGYAAEVCAPTPRSLAILV